MNQPMTMTMTTRVTKTVQSSLLLLRTILETISILVLIVIVCLFLRHLASFNNKSHVCTFCKSHFQCWQSKESKQTEQTKENKQAKISGNSINQQRTKQSSQERPVRKFKSLKDEHRREREAGTKQDTTENWWGLWKQESTKNDKTNLKATKATSNILKRNPNDDRRDHNNENKEPIKLQRKRYGYRTFQRKQIIPLFETVTTDDDPKQQCCTMETSSNTFQKFCNFRCYMNFQKLQSDTRTKPVSISNGVVQRNPFA